MQLATALNTLQCLRTHASCEESAALFADLPYGSELLNHLLQISEAGVNVR
jgi:hypothetical protein